MAPLTKSQIPLTIYFGTDPSVSKKKPWVIFTHHFGGNAESSHRHVAVLNEMNYDCVTFNFSWHGNPTRHPLPVNMIDGWSFEIESVVNELENREPGRGEILFSFSGPSASALFCIQRLLPNQNIKAFICDSGPFAEAKDCTRNMLEFVYGIKGSLKQKVALEVLMVMWGATHNRKLSEVLDEIVKVNPNLPILSIRGLRDKIVPISNIRKVFDNKKFLKLISLDLDCGHLTGLKERTSAYKEALTHFLEGIEI